MAATVWQQLGATVYTGGDLGADQIEHFKKVGGKWLCPWVYQDMNAEANLALVPYWRKQGLLVGGVFNVFGGDPETDAANIAQIAKANSLSLVTLDIEAAYQYPNPGCALMPILLSSLRQKLPSAQIGVNTNCLNDSMIWNGGSGGKSCYSLGIRVLPQWYSAPRYEGSTWTDPEKNMRWMQSYGDKDNFYDPKQQYHRAVPFSYIHPQVEPTGVEGAILQVTIDSLVRAQKLGFSVGISLFALERVPESDWALLSRFQGRLWY